LLVRIRPHEMFQRDGNDLVCRRDISFAMAAIGGTLRIETLDGTAELKVPSGMQTHSVLTVHGLGMPRPGGKGRGDLRVTLVVKTPTNLTPRQKTLLGELYHDVGEQRPRRKWWK
jgi:molecular chaperone DnaJ